MWVWVRACVHKKYTPYVNLRLHLGYLVCVRVCTLRVSKRKQSATCELEDGSE